MKQLLLSLLIFGFGISGSLGQTIKSLGYNTTNGRVVYSGTNTLTFTNGTTAFNEVNVTNELTLGGVNGVLFFADLDGAQDIFGFDSGAGGPDEARARTNLGLGWSALTNTNSATTLLGHNTNGQVVYSGTNTLTFTNRVSQSSTNATNPPELRLTTKSNNVASWFVYDAVQTNPAAPHWAVAWYGLNTVPNATGTDRSRVNESIGAASLTIENMWMSPAPDPDAPLAEFYFNITDTNNLTTRGFSVIGNQTNSTIGFSDFVYPVTIYYNSNSRSWYGNDYLGLNVVSTNTGELARFTHSTTNPSGTAQIYLQVQNNQTVWQAGLTHTYLRNFGAGRNAFRVETNGVIYGATGAATAPQAPVHLAGNTRIDGAISFDATSNAATTRTNLELGTTNTPTFRRLVVDPNASGALGVQYGTNDSGIYNGETYNILSLRVGGVNALTAQTNGVTFADPATTRTNLGLGETDAPNFESVSVGGDFRVTDGTNDFAVIAFDEAFFDVGVTIASSLGLTFSGTNAATAAAATRTNLGLGATNDVQFKNVIAESFREVDDESYITFDNEYLKLFADGSVVFQAPFVFENTTNATISRASLGLGATWLTNTNVTNFRTAIGLGAADSIYAYEFRADFTGSDFVVLQGSGVQFAGISAANTRTNLGLGGGITTNRTFVSYNGTNYTTNTVTISNGIITGWTQ